MKMIQVIMMIAEFYEDDYNLMSVLMKMFMTLFAETRV